MSDDSPRFDPVAMQQSITQPTDVNTQDLFKAGYTQDDQKIRFEDLNNRYRWYVCRLVHPDVSDTVATLGGKFYVPFAGRVPKLYAYVDTPGTTGTMTVDFKKGGVTFATASIATGDQGSPIYTSSSGGVSFVTLSLFTFTVTAVHTTPALGLTIVMKMSESTS